MDTIKIKVCEHCGEFPEVISEGGICGIVRLACLDCWNEEEQPAWGGSLAAAVKSWNESQGEF